MCSWSIACRCCSNYIFILHLTHGFNVLRKDKCKPRRKSFTFWDLVPLILHILRHIWNSYWFTQTIRLYSIASWYLHSLSSASSLLIHKRVIKTNNLNSIWHVLSVCLSLIRVYFIWHTLLSCLALIRVLTSIYLHTEITSFCRSGVN